MPKSPTEGAHEYLSAQDTARELGVSVGMIRLLVLQGDLSVAATTRGRRWMLFDPKVVEQLRKVREKAKGRR